MKKALLIILMIMTTGCLTVPTKAYLSPDVPFEGRKSKINKTVGLYIGPKSRAYIAEYCVPIVMSSKCQTFTLDIGPSLENNSIRAFKNLFKDVVVVDSYKSTKYPATISITVNPKTNIFIGKYAASPRMVEIHINCRAYRKGKKVADKTFHTKFERKTAKGYLAGSPFFFKSSRDAAMGKLELAAAESLMSDLNKCMDYLYEKRRSLF